MIGCPIRSGRITVRRTGITRRSTLPKTMHGSAISKHRCMTAHSHMASLVLVGLLNFSIVQIVTRHRDDLALGDQFHTETLFRGFFDDGRVSFVSALEYLDLASNQRIITATSATTPTSTTSSSPSSSTTRVASNVGGVGSKVVVSVLWHIHAI